MTQFGFFFDKSRCDGCGACAVVCKDWYDLPPGSVKWLRVHQWETGTWPNPRVHQLVVQCWHCENPICVDACPNKAMFKEEKYGAVLIDQDKCKGARRCWVACPYGAPTYASDAPTEKASMCNMCIDRLEQGMKPICVLSCPVRALDFDTLENLQKKYGTLRDLPGMPSSAEVKPAVVFKDAVERKQLVPYDANKALEINAKSPVGNVFYTAPSDVTDLPEKLISRNKLVIKPKNAAEFMHYTRDNES